MSWFSHDGKKKKAKQEEETAASESASEPKKRPHGKLHTRRKKKTLLAKMKLTQSVPSTIVDALHGDSSIVSSDKDYVYSPALQFSDGTWYPVFILDEQDLENAGLGDKNSREVLGQLSVGLKTSSGATGFVPVVTTESLAENYIGLLPMHDAFEVLRDFTPSVFMDYKQGWPVGLVRIDNDELTLKKTDMHLSMPQWLQYINKEVSLVVDHDQLKFSMDAKSNADPLAVDSQEAEGGAAGGDDVPAVHDLDTDNMVPTGEFDDDDGVASNSNISAFVNSQNVSPVNSTATDSDPSTGYDIPDIVSDSGNDETGTDTDNLAGQDIPDTVDNSNDVKPAPGFNDVPDVNSMSTVDGSSEPINPLDLEPAGNDDQNQVPVDNGNTNPDFNNQGAPLSGPVNDNASQQSRPTPNPQVRYQESRTRDDLEAQNAILSTSVRSLDDLQVSISDQEFVDSYLSKLTVETLPMLDDSNDPTGRIHHINMLRQQANMELQGALAERRARLRQWFETERSGILEALRQGTREDSSMIKSERELLERLKKQLADRDTLIAQATTRTVDAQNKLQAAFDQEYRTAKQDALVQVDQKFNDRRRTLESQKQDVIDNDVSDQQHEISSKITDAKNRIQQIAQQEAGKAYATVMEGGAKQFHKMQLQLEHRRHLLLDKLDQSEQAYRDAENRRAEHEAEIAQHDTTIAQLKDQLQRQKESADEAAKRAETEKRDALQQVQNEADAAQEQAVARVQDELENVKSENQKLENKLATISDHYDQKAEEKQAEYQSKLDAKDKETEQKVAELSQTNKHFTRWMVAAIFAFGAVTGGASWFAGQIHGVNMMKSEISRIQANNSNSNNDTNDSRSQAPYIIQVPSTGNSNSSNNVNDDNNSSSNSHKMGSSESNSNHDSSSQSSSSQHNNN